MTRALRSKTQKRVEAQSKADGDEEDNGIEVDQVNIDSGVEGSGASDNEGSGMRGKARIGGSADSHDTGSSDGSSLNRALHALHPHNSSSRMNDGSFGETDDDFDDGQSCCGRVSSWCACLPPRSLKQQRQQSQTNSDGKHHHSHRKRRTYRNTSTAKMSLIVGMIWPFLLYIAYFGGIIGYRYSVADTVRYVKNEVLWTKQTQFYVGKSNLQLRHAFGYCDPSFQRNSIELGLEYAETLEFLVNSLLYGNENMKLRAGVHVSDEIYDLSMVNGCVGVATGYYSASDCLSFYNGLFARGWIQGFREYMHTMRELLSLRLGAQCGSRVIQLRHDDHPQRLRG